MKKTTAYELIIEIGVEEMPSPLIPIALSDLKENTCRRFSLGFLSHGPLHLYATPRRLIAHLPQLADRQEARIETILGPPAKIAFDLKGNPTAAAVGFAKGLGVPVSKLVITKTEKGEYLSFSKKTASQPTVALLKEMIPEIIASLRFQKSMRWNGTGSFIRPIRWLVALYNQKIIAFDFAQIRSNNLSYGHRLLSPDQFEVTDFTSFQKALRKRFVLIDPVERYNLIKKQINSLALKAGGKIAEDDPLLWQAVYSTEYPVAICGEFDPQFLSIPKEIIGAAMKEHQGYFPVMDPNGKIQPRFIAILNNQDKNQIIRKGNERVLSARLSDAKFFFDEDRKGALIDRYPALKTVQFHEGLGTLWDKSQRLIKLSQFIASRVIPPLTQESIEALERSAILCKADLTTGVVREFPSLQGVIGRILTESSDANAAVAIEEHYQPRYPGDSLPQSDLGRILSVADKLDTIVGCFLIGAIPTGSEDPYALRRQGLGVIQILSAIPFFKHASGHLSLSEIINKGIACYQEGGVAVPIGVANKNRTPLEEIETFFMQRVTFSLQAEGIRHDIIDAVLGGNCYTGLYEIVQRARGLARFSKTSLFDPLIICYKRAARILPIDIPVVTANDNLLTKEAKGLKNALENIKEEVMAYCKQRQFDNALAALATLDAPLHSFFGKVLVMDPDEDIRHNNLFLLRTVKNLFDQLGDFAKIQEGGG